MVYTYSIVGAYLDILQHNKWDDDTGRFFTAEQLRKSENKTGIIKCLLYRSVACIPSIPYRARYNGEPATVRSTCPTGLSETARTT